MRPGRIPGQALGNWLRVRVALAHAAGATHGDPWRRIPADSKGNSQFIFPANRARATRSGCAVFCAAGANCRNDTHPISISRNAEFGTELSIPLPITAVVNEINKYIRLSLSVSRH